MDIRWRCPSVVLSYSQNACNQYYKDKQLSMKTNIAKSFNCVYRTARILAIIFIVAYVGYFNLPLYGQNGEVKDKSEIAKFEIGGDAVETQWRRKILRLYTGQCCGRQGCCRFVETQYFASPILRPILRLHREVSILLAT
jgi:hypothetical protein